MSLAAAVRDASPVAAPARVRLGLGAARAHGAMVPAPAGAARTVPSRTERVRVPSWPGSTGSAGEHEPSRDVATVGGIREPPGPRLIAVDALGPRHAVEDRGRSRGLDVLEADPAGR